MKPTTGSHQPTLRPIYPMKHPPQFKAGSNPQVSQIPPTPNFKPTPIPPSPTSLNLAQLNFRSLLLQSLVLVCFFIGLGKAAYLQLLTPNRLQDRGAVRYERNLIMSAHRGRIFDRNGNEMAGNITTSAVSLVGSQAKLTEVQKDQLAELLEMSRDELDSKQKQAKLGFIYLRRQLDLTKGRYIREQIRALKMPGITVDDEPRRHYPLAEAASQLIGFVNLSGEAIEGLEFKLNNRLSGTEGSRRVVRTGVGSIVDNLKENEPVEHGEDIQLTIDNGLQHLTYAELRNAVMSHNAEGGSAVMLNAKTGEVLALANYPSFDPNKSGKRTSANIRNRAITDAFEPGSIIKPFTMSLALDKNIISSKTTLDGTPFMVNTLRIHDGEHIRPIMTLAEVMQYSSNVGIVRMSQKLTAKDMHAWFSSMGFGKVNKLPMGGATTGLLRPFSKWQAEDKATAAYGYGLSTSLLQVARAYTVFTNHGQLLPVSLLKLDTPPQGVAVMKADTADLLRKYMKSVTGPQGTAPLAQVDNYTTAGKTGTARKQKNGQYLEGQYIASFVGFAPASNPKVIVAVMIDAPKGEKYYGGQVAAPVFSNMVSAAMRMMNVTPDKPKQPVLLAPSQINSPKESTL
jgi:cell division protein FtsI (penicillin-binding protein 3)